MIVADFTIFFPWMFLRHLITTLFVYNIVHAFVKDKFNSVLTCGIYCAVGLAWAWFSSVTYNGRVALDFIFLFVFIALMMALTILLTQGKLILKIISVVLAILFETLSSSIFSAITHTGTATQLPLAVYASLLGFWLCSAFFWVAIIRLITNNIRKHMRYNNKYLMYYIYPITHMVLFMMIAYFISSVDKEVISKVTDAGLYEIVISAFAGVCIIADVVLIFIIDHNQATEERALKSERKLMKSQMDYEQALMLKKEKEEFRRLRHDFANITATASGFIEIGKPEKALSILKSTDLNLTGLAGFTVCSNEVVNTILYTKLQQAKSQQVKLNINISEDELITVDDYDLCRVLSNLIDNQLNAVLTLDGEKECTLNISSKEGVVTVTGENKFNPKNNNKKRAGDHGNGSKIIRSIAKAHGGAYEHTVTGDTYYTTTTLKNTK